jgi:excisionase family DNA binding protein
VKSTTSSARDVMSPEQLADYLGCGRTHAYAILKAGDIPSFTMGRLRRVRRVDVDRYVEQRLRETQP